MKKILRFFCVSVLSCASLSVFAQDYEWTTIWMDGSRTGCVASSKDNVDEALGKVRRGKYISPSGRTFKKNSCTAKIARAVIAVQPQMVRVKEVVGYAPESIYKAYPESPLSNMFVDRIMAAVQELSGKRVDVGVGNFGGIRLDELKGDILLDDMLSMFPFKNQVVYVAQKGSVIRQWLEKMAAGNFQVLGGVTVEAEDGKLVKALIGGEPIDDDKVYGVATISFLLNGGDRLNLGAGAVETEVFDVDVIDIMLDYVKGLAASGRPVTYSSDSRVVIR